MDGSGDMVIRQSAGVNAVILRSNSSSASPLTLCTLYSMVYCELLRSSKFIEQIGQAVRINSNCANADHPAHKYMSP